MRYTLLSVWRFYVEGFGAMTWGRLLWLIIILKLLVLFFVLRLIFFPDYLSMNATDVSKDDFVSRELIIRAD